MIDPKKLFAAFGIDHLLEEKHLIPALAQQIALLFDGLTYLVVMGGVIAEMEAVVVVILDLAFDKSQLLKRPHVDDGRFFILVGSHLSHRAHEFLIKTDDFLGFTKGDRNIYISNPQRAQKRHRIGGMKPEPKAKGAHYIRCTVDLFVSVRGVIKFAFLFKTIEALFDTRPIRHHDTDDDSAWRC